MSLLTLSDLIAAYKTVSPDKEWALGGLEDANKFANAIEAAVIKKLATVSVEPVGDGYTMVVTTNAESSSLHQDRRIVVTGVPVYTTEALAAARVQAINDALNCYSPDDTATDWSDKIRALAGGSK